MFRALRIAALATTALAAPGFAQTLPVPPTRELIDENGVDLFRGSFTVERTVASIGGSQGMAYRESFRGPNFGNNIDALIQSSANTFFVTFNGRTDRFTKSGSTYTPTEANGATLAFASNIYTYTARDGTVVTFSKALIAGHNIYGNEGLVTAIVQPDGQRLDYNYRNKVFCEYYEGDVCAGGFTNVRRLETVRSAYGYALKNFYVTDDLEDGSGLLEYTTISDQRLVNLAVDYCGTLDCTLTQSWPGPSNPNHLINNYITTGGLITGVRRPGSASNDITIAYAGGKVSSVADHSGSTSYAYADASGERTVTVTNSLSQVSTYTFNIASERLTKFKDALNHETTYSYDGNARLTRITRPEGNYTNFTYDARGNVTEVRHVGKPGSGVADIVTTAAFPSTCSNPKTCNSPTSATDARGNATDYTYNSTHGGVLTVTGPAPTAGATRPKQTFTYVTSQAQIKNSSGGIVGSGTNITLPQTVSQCATLASCSGGADEVKSTVTYGTTGVANNLQPTQVDSGNGTGTLTATTKFSYDTIGNLVTVDGPLAGTEDTTTAVYDNLRRQVGTISPDPDGAGARPRLAQKLEYTTRGDLELVKIGTTPDATPAGWAAFAEAYRHFSLHDLDGRVIRQTVWSSGVDFAVADHLYDSEGRRTCTVQYMNPAQWGPQASTCAPLQTSGPLGPDRVTRTVYDANGRPTQVQVAVGITGQQANERTLAYNANGTLAHLIDANDNRTTYEYDGHDRLVKTRFPLPAIGSNSSSTTDYEQLTLDPNGNVTTRRLRDARSIGYTYDALNRMTLMDVPAEQGVGDVTYAYDLLNRLTSATQPGLGLTLGWDALGRKTSEQQPFGSLTWQYDLAGRRTRATWWDGFYVQYDRDVLGNVTFVRENGAASGVGVLATYQYDSLSRRSSVTFGNGVAQSYTYDNASRLATQVNDLAATANDLTQTFSYNPASQISSVTRSNDLYAWTGHSNVNLGSTPNGLNQIGNVGASTVTHDTKGNITGIGAQTFTHSAENFLTQASGGVTLYYDPLRRLVEYDTAVSTRFVFDGVVIAAEVDNPAGAIQRRYVRGDGMDAVLVEYVGSGTSNRRFLSSDERGSITSVTDSSGAVVALNKYDEFGVPQSANLGRFGYTGQAWLGELGLWYYKARMYRPDIGRFLQTDPIGYEDSPNLYAYVLNDPVGLFDPLGLTWATGRMPGAEPTGSQLREALGTAFPHVDQAMINGAVDFYLRNRGMIDVEDMGAAYAAIYGGNDPNLESSLAGLYNWSPLSSEEDAIVQAILGIDRFQDRLDYIWDQTMKTGLEHGFFVYLNSLTETRLTITVSRVYTGTIEDMGIAFAVRAQYGPNFFMTVHTHPAFWSVGSAFPSLGDLTFSGTYNAVGMLRSWNGISYGRCGGVC